MVRRWLHCPRHDGQRRRRQHSAPCESRRACRSRTRTRRFTQQRTATHSQSRRHAATAANLAAEVGRCHRPPSGHRGRFQDQLRGLQRRRNA
jgi:hypothetical protein